MKNENNECFIWCHIRHLNPQDKYPQKIKKSDKALVNTLNYSNIEFPVNRTTTRLLEGTLFIFGPSSIICARAERGCK